jgi:hypothetical protein
MRRFFLLLTLTLAACSFSFAQFQARYGSPYRDEARAVVQTHDGNFVVAGLTNGFGSAGNPLLMKVDGSGSILWVKDFNGINPDMIYDILETPAHELVMCGYTNSYGVGSADAFVMKTDSLGNILWVRAFGGIYGDYLHRITQDSTGGFYAAGATADSATGVAVGLLMRLDNLGNLTWSKRINNFYFLEDPVELLTAHNGDALYAQHMGTNLEIGICRFTPTGTLKWQSGRRPSSGAGGPINTGMVENQFDEIVVGFTTSNTITVAESQDIFFINFDSNGTYLSTESVGGLYFDNIRRIIMTQDNKYLVTGSTNSGGNGDYDAFLMKLNYDKTPIWARAYGDVWYDEALDVFENSDKGFVLSGITFSTGSLYDSAKVHLVRTDSAGFSDCNTVNFFPVRREQVASSIFPFTIEDFSLTGNGVTWMGKNRSLYEYNFCAPTQVGDADAATSLSLAPNPIAESATLRIGRPIASGTLRILNAQGQQMGPEASLRGDSHMVERGNLPAGIYLLQVMEEGKALGNVRMVVQ